MYKSRTGGHNKSSTKEKRNTYPPLFSKLRRENALGLIFVRAVPEEIFDHPKHERLKEFLAKVL